MIITVIFIIFFSTRAYTIIYLGIIYSRCFDFCATEMETTYNPPAANPTTDTSSELKNTANIAVPTTTTASADSPANAPAATPSAITTSEPINTANIAVSTSATASAVSPTTATTNHTSEPHLTANTTASIEGNTSDIVFNSTFEPHLTANAGPTNATTFTTDPSWNDTTADGLCF